MKKILCYGVLAFLLLLPITVCVEASRKEVLKTTDTYSVLLPKNVDVSQNSTTFDVSVKNNNNYVVKVSIPKSVVLQNTDKAGERVPVQVAFANDVNFGVNETKKATLTHGDLSTGKWNTNLNVTIKAEANKYTFHFDGNGATSGSMSDIQSYFGKNFVLPECMFTKDYYTFSHYKLYKIDNGVKKYYYVKNNSTGDSKETRDWFEVNKQPSGWTESIPKPGSEIYSKLYNIKNGENVYLEAQWQKNTVTINYHANGGTRIQSDTNKPLDTPDPLLTWIKNFDFETDYTGLHSFKAGTLDMIRDGYHHPGYDKEWVVNYPTSGIYQHGQNIFIFKDLAEKAGKDEELKKGNVTIDLYANWIPNTYKITFDSNGGTGGPTTQSFKYSSGEKITTSVPTRKGYAFVNWKFTDNDGYEHHFKPGDIIPSGYGDFTLAAQWVIDETQWELLYDDGKKEYNSFNNNEFVQTDIDLTPIIEKNNLLGQEILINFELYSENPVGQMQIYIQNGNLLS